MIAGHVFHQRLNLIDSHVVADTIDYLEVKFIFKTDDWAGLTKWAHFANGDIVYDIPLTDDGIRKEDHLNLSPGTWQVYLHGNGFTDGEVTKRITTSVAALNVLPTGTLDGEPFPEIPASETERILARLEKLEKGGGGPSVPAAADHTLGVTGASVGQIARITAVDENGVPTAWEAFPTLRLAARVVTEEISAAIEITGLNILSDALSVRLYNPGTSCGVGWNITINDETKNGYAGDVKGSSTEHTALRGWIYKLDGTWVSRTLMSNNGINIGKFSHGEPIEKLAFKPYYNDGETKYFQAGTILEVYEGVYPNVN